MSTNKRQLVLVSLVIILLGIMGYLVFFKLASERTRLTEMNERIQSLQLANLAFRDYRENRLNRSLGLAIQATQSNYSPIMAERLLIEAFYTPKLDYYTGLREGTTTSPLLANCPNLSSRHTQALTAVDISPDNSLIVTGDTSGKTIVWTIDGCPIRIIGSPVNNVSVTKVIFQPNSDEIIAGYTDGSIVIWNTTTRNLIKWISEPTPSSQDAVNAFAFDKLGNNLLVGYTSGLIVRWNASTGEKLKEYRSHLSSITAIDFSDDGLNFVSASDDRTVKYWTVDNPTPIIDFPQKHQERITSLDLSSDGDHIVSGSEDRSVILWSVASKSLEQIFRHHTDSVRVVEFNPTGRELLSASDDKTIVIFSIDDSTPSITLGEREFGHKGSIAAAKFSSDGEYIRSISLFDAQYVRWSTSYKDVLHKFDLKPNYVLPISLITQPPNSDGNFMSMLTVSGRGEPMRLWEFNEQSGRASYIGDFKNSQTVSRGIFTPDGTCVIAGKTDGNIVLYQASRVSPTLDIINTFSSPNFASKDNRVNAIAITIDIKNKEQSCGENTIVASASDQSIYIWNGSTHSLIKTLIGHKSNITSLDFDDSGKTLVSGDVSGTVIVWDMEQVAQTNTILGDIVFEGEEPVYSIYIGNQKIFWTNGNNISSFDRETRKLRSLEGHKDVVQRLALEGNYLVSISRDSTAILWDAKRGEDLYQYKLDRPAISIDILPSQQSALIVLEGVDDKTSIVNVDIPSIEKVVKTLQAEKLPIYQCEPDEDLVLPLPLCDNNISG